MERSNLHESVRSGAASSENGAGNPHLQTLGALLRERREAAGISLAEVEKSTRIRQKYLVALEADEWHLLPGEVVGRGFLRNYANFLNLDAGVIMDRRRTNTDSTLNRSLAHTSAGASLPPVREVDYRPKDVDLEQTPVSSRINEYVEAGQVWFAPIAATIAIVLLIIVLGWGIIQIGDQVVDVVRGLPQRALSLVQIDEADTPSLPTVADNPGAENTNDGTGGIALGGGDSGSSDAGGSETNEGDGAPRGALVLAETETPTPAPPSPIPATNTPEPATSIPTDTPAPLPTNTPTPVPPPPTNTPVPLPPTNTPVPVPTDTPAPQVVAPSCPDGRSTIASPGVNQVVSGSVAITGSATHEQFNYYKLEYAPGADAQDGYVYFDGAESPVANGGLGTFISSSFPNGAYTIQLTVVDQTGNYPPRCRVTITVQN